VELFGLILAINFVYAAVFLFLERKIFSEWRSPAAPQVGRLVEPGHRCCS
jgi:hypothetical protein